MVSDLETFLHIFTAHAHERLFRSFWSKMWPCHSLRSTFLKFLTSIYTLCHFQGATTKF